MLEHRSRQAGAVVWRSSGLGSAPRSRARWMGGDYAIALGPMPLGVVIIARTY